MEEIRKQLQQFISYEEGEKLRNQLHDFALKNYKSKYTSDKQIEFLDRHSPSFTINHPQETNFPYYFTMFTVLTQHIQGDCVSELLDIGIDIENNQK